MKDVSTKNEARIIILSLFIYVACFNDKSSRNLQENKGKIHTAARDSTDTSSNEISYFILDIDDDKVDDTLFIDNSKRFYPSFRITLTNRKSDNVNTTPYILPVNSCFEGSDYSLAYLPKKGKSEAAYTFSLAILTWGKYDNQLFFDFSNSSLKLVYFKYFEKNTELHGETRDGKKVAQQHVITRSKATPLNVIVADTLDTEFLCSIIQDSAKYPFKETTDIQNVKLESE